jgi:hypothetical protein
MKASRYTGEQIVGILKGVEARLKVSEAGRQCSKYIRSQFRIE